MKERTAEYIAGGLIVLVMIGCAILIMLAMQEPI